MTLALAPPMRDLRHACRQLARAPGFSVVAVLTLAIGIGACTAIFSVVNSVLLRPLAFPQSGRLVVIRETKLPAFPEFSVASGQYLDWRQQATSFENLAAFRGGSYNLTGAGQPVRVVAQRATASYFPTLRVRPALGRDFAADEDTPGKENVAILSHGFWQRHFAGRPEVLGSTVQLDGQSFTVVGVMPADFQREGRTEIFTPLAFGPRDRANHGGHNLNVVARLKPGVTVEEARREMTVIAGRLEQRYPGSNKGWGVKLTPMLEARVGDVQTVLFSLLGAVGFLLLIACANVANLLLARGTTRAKEIAVRAALGASRRRLLAQLLVESLLLAVLGALLGVLLARLGISALLAFAPQNLPRAGEIAIDGRVLAFTCALALVTGIGFGLLPAFQATSIDLNQTLKDSARGASAGSRRQRLRGALVMAEVAIAVILLVGAGLLVRSFTRLQQVNPGFQARGVMAVDLSLPRRKYTTDAQKIAFVDQAVSSLAAIPGVQFAGASQIIPLSGDDYVLGLDLQGRDPDPNPAARQNTLYYAVTPGYFQALGIPLLRGRLFDQHDVAGSSRVVIISQSTARHLFAGEDPIGKRISVTNGPVTWREVVGVVGDVKHYRLEGNTGSVERFMGQTYEPLAQKPFDFFTFVLRSASGTETGLPAAIRSAIDSVDKDQAVAAVKPVTVLVSDSIARQRFTMFLFAVFSGVALLLAAIGIYGVMAYAVSQRTGEIGIRMALGAQPGNVLGLILAQGGRLVVLGFAAGVGGALLLTRLLASLLFEVSPHDPVTFGAIIALLSLVAAAACLVPARRATRVDPMVALRAE